MLLVRILSWKRLIAFLAAFMVAVLAANLTFTFVTGSARSLDLVLTGGERDSVLVLERSARSIYTSHIPASLAISLCKLSSVEAYPLIVTIGYASGLTLVVRGLQSLSELRATLLSGSLPSDEGSWIVLGERAAEKLKARVDETISLASSIRRRVLLMTVAAVCRFGDIKDDEAIVHEKSCRQLSGLPQGMVSAVVVQGASRETVEHLLSRTYQLKVKCSSNIMGSLVILEANGAPIRSLKVTREIEESLDLPFGYYTVTFQNPYLVTTLGTVLLDSEKSFEGKVEIEEKPVLKVPGPDRPVLRRPDGVELQGAKQGTFWVFETSPGVYTLELGGRTYSIPLFHSATFDPTLPKGQTHTVRVRVTWSDGSEAEDYNLVVRTIGGDVVLSMLGLAGEMKIDLPEGNYVLEAYRLPFSASAVLSVPRLGEVKLILPSIRWNIEKIPFQYYTFIKAMPAEEVASFTLGSIAGISAALLVGLSLSMVALFIMLVVNIQNYLYLSAGNRLTLIGLLGASRRFVVKTLMVPMLIIECGIATITSVITYSIANTVFSSKLTLFGHAMLVDILTTFLFSLSLVACVWLFGSVKLLRTLARV